MNETDAKITLSEVLRGTSPGRVQSVGLMQVIPLVSDFSDDRFAMPGQVLVGTSDFGSLVFRNPTDKSALIPKDAAYVTKQRAQDHALPHVGFIGAGAQKTYNDAACIQETQGGTMQPEAHELIILPFPLREAALRTRLNRNFDKLWSVIRSFNAAMGLRSIGHVDIYLEQFGRQLSRFVAEFEIVPKQIGAIVLINGKVAGIERVPSYEYWTAIWPTLIRESYGSLALYTQRKEGDQNPARPLPTRIRLDSNVDSVGDLIAVVQEARAAEEEATRQIVRDLMNEQVTTETDETFLGLTVETMTSRHFVGQCVRDGLQTIYASMVATEQRLAVASEAVTAFAV